MLRIQTPMALANIGLIGLMILLLSGCQQGGSGPHSPAAQRHQSNANRPGTPDSTPPLVLVEGQALRVSDLSPMLLEAVGGQVLAEIVLEKMVDRKLAAEGLKLSTKDFQRERELFARTLSDDPVQAKRLSDRLRERRGLGPIRFDRLLHRNAGLRRLASQRVRITEVHVQRAYQLHHGARYQCRLIVVESLSQANAILRKLRAGESFAKLATDHSTDVSRAQGGLLPSISPADDTFPVAIRKAIANLKPGQNSNPIDLSNGYALLRVEKITPPDGTPFAKVKDKMTDLVRQRLERVEMQRVARELLTQADVVVLDRTLKKSWQQQRAGMLQEK